jgi:hypothetical protein
MQVKLTELRRRCRDLATEFAAALPDGGAGLIEAERRIREVGAREKALHTEFGITMEMERDILIPIIEKPRNRRYDFIEKTPPRTMAGVAGTY